jgi:hypothetical protein
VGRQPKLAPLAAEYQDAELGDERLQHRLVQVAGAVAAEPAASFPLAAGNDAELEATYRFLNNDRVSAEAILAPHRRQTAMRARDATTVVVAHDTTEFNFGKSSRRDLGRVGQGKSFGFYGHFALAIEADEHRTPLGVAALDVHRRTGGKGRRGHHALQSATDNEFHRWRRVIAQARELLEPEVAAVHVMDREADSYAFMAELSEANVRFVIRMAQASRLVVGKQSVAEVLVGAPIVAEREVPISFRGASAMPSYRKHHPPRNSRLAMLEMSATRVTLLRPSSANASSAKTLSLNVVRVVEPNPPEGEQPIEWRLWTLEPVDTADQVLAVVDWYRCRWRIEEYFKALKTGCAIEQRQLESHHALVNALALYCPIAWRLLLLRTVARRSAPRAASDVLNTTQLKCLRGALEKLKRPTLPPRPTARDAMLGVAGLGGHIKNNGDPGWAVLGRGLDRLLTIELGYCLAVEQQKM